jgi:biotin carboxyl carrier protein
MALGQDRREYIAITGDKQRTVHVEPEGNDLRVNVDGESFLVGSQPYGDGSVCLLLNSQPRIVHVRNRQPGRFRVTLGGSEMAVEIADPIAARIGRVAGAAQESGQIEIRSPMPGTVVLVHVAEGDEVEEDSPLVVLEAMKMQNALNSPAPAVVREVKCEAGQSVEGESLLIVLDRKTDA